MEKINIALPSDENYVCGLTVTAASIAKYASRDVTLAFHILDGGIKDETFARFEALVRGLHPHCEFVRHAVNEEAFGDFPSWSGNRMTYARLLLPQFLPEDEFCIYCDTDFLWLTDIAGLWDLRRSDVIFQGVHDTCESTLDKEEAWFVAHGFPFDRARYVCAGLSFYNLRMMREENVIGKVHDFIVSHPDIKMADQSAIYALMGDQIVLLDTQWQRLTMSREDDEPVMGKALHYAGEIPWKRGFWIEMMTDTILLWHRFNGQIHGKSTWWSLRQWFSVTTVVCRRALWYVQRLPVVRSLFKAFLKTSGRGFYVKLFAERSHSADWRI